MAAWLRADGDLDDSTLDALRVRADSSTLDGDDAPGDRAGDLTVTEVVERYVLRRVHVRFRRNGELTREAANIKLALRSLHEQFGTLPASAFGPRLLQQLREDLIGRGLCRNEVNRRIKYVRPQESGQPRACESRYFRDEAAMKRSRFTEEQIVHVAQRDAEGTGEAGGWRRGVDACGGRVEERARGFVDVEPITVPCKRSGVRADRVEVAVEVAERDGGGVVAVHRHPCRGGIGDGSEAFVEVEPVLLTAVRELRGVPEDDVELAVTVDVAERHGSGGARVRRQPLPVELVELPSSGGGSRENAEQHRNERRAARRRQIA